MAATASLLRRCLSQWTTKASVGENAARPTSFHSSPSLSFSGLFSNTSTRSARQSQSIKLHDLPHELLLDIAEYLDKRDLYRLRVVSRVFRDITSRLIFHRVRLRLQSRLQYGYCLQHGWNVQRDHVCDSLHSYHYPLTVQRLAEVLPQYFDGVNNSKRKTDRHERWTTDPLISPITAMLNAEAPTAAFGSMRELLISLPAQWARISDSGYGVTLLYFAEHVFPRMFKRMASLRAIHVQAHLYYETVDIVLTFLHNVCRLCGDKDIDVHIKLVYGYPANEYSHLSDFRFPSRCIGKLFGLKSLTFQAHGGCDDAFKGEALELIKRSPRMDQDPEDTRGSFYEGTKLTLCNIGTRDTHWGWDDWGRE